MNEKRWKNVSRARSAYREGGSESGYPLEAFFEISARCNLRCQMCAINYDQRYKPEAGRPPFFTPDLFARLKPIFPTLLRGYLFGLGEPLLNPHLVDYVRELSTAGVEVCFNTNATLIDDEKAETLAAAGVDRITVSIDGATASTYETVRIGAKFSSVMRGIEALVAAGKRHGRPAVDFSFVAMRSNLEEIPQLVELCARMGATGLHVEPLFSQVGSAELDDHYQRENAGLIDADIASRVFQESIALAKNLGVSFGSRFLSVREHFDYREEAKDMHVDWTCSEPWSAIWVTSAGEVRVCCLNDTTFGNLFESSFDDIWNGELFRRFRLQHARREEAMGCANCALNGRVRNSTFFRPTQPVTYRPYFSSVPPTGTDDLLVIDSPAPGATITDPLIIRGRVQPGVDLRQLDLMIDYTPVANFNDLAFRNHKEFVLALPVPHLSEGAHVIWGRYAGDKQGVAHREVHCWKPARLHAAFEQAVLVVRAGSSNVPRLTIGGRRWRAVRWSSVSNPRGRFMMGIADLSDLEPGSYDVEVAAGQTVLMEMQLQRLPVR